MPQYTQCYLYYFALSFSALQVQFCKQILLQRLFGRGVLAKCTVRYKYNQGEQKIKSLCFTEQFHCWISMCFEREKSSDIYPGKLRHGMIIQYQLNYTLMLTNIREMLFCSERASRLSHLLCTAAVPRSCRHE